MCGAHSSSIFHSSSTTTNSGHHRRAPSISLHEVSRPKLFLFQGFLDALDRLLWFGIGTPRNRASFRALRWPQRERRVSDETVTRMIMYGWVLLPCCRREHAKRRPSPTETWPPSTETCSNLLTHISLGASPMSNRRVIRTPS